MYKETIKYLDFNGVEREEDFYFHMTKAEVIKYAVSENGGLEAVIDELIKTNDVWKALGLFERLIRMGYGKRSVDGRYFTKSPEAIEQFISSEAYSNLFMKFFENPNYAAEFVNGIIASVPKSEDENSDKTPISSVSMA